MIQIGILENHLVMRDQLTRLLEKEEDFEVVFAGNSFDQASLLENIHSLSMDILIIDISTHRFDGFTALRLLKQRAPMVKTLALCSYEYPEYEERAKEAGASAVVFKNNLFIDLVRQVRALFSSPPSHQRTG